MRPGRNRQACTKDKLVSLPNPLEISVLTWRLPYRETRLEMNESTRCLVKAILSLAHGCLSPCLALPDRPQAHRNAMPPVAEGLLRKRSPAAVSVAQCLDFWRACVYNIASAYYRNFGVWARCHWQCWWAASAMSGSLVLRWRCPSGFRAISCFRPCQYEQRQEEGKHLFSRG